MPSSPVVSVTVLPLRATQPSVASLSFVARRPSPPDVTVIDAPCTVQLSLPLMPWLTAFTVSATPSMSSVSLLVTPLLQLPFTVSAPPPAITRSALE